MASTRLDETLSRGLILIRHAMSDVQPGLASKLWGITEPAREDCVLLAHALPGQVGPSVYTSSEKKAEETAAVIALRRGLSVTIDPAFGEVDRPASWDEDYRALAAAYLDGAEHPGWEPRDRVVDRFAKAMERALEASPRESDLVVVDHGLALSLYLDSVAEIELVPFWRALTFPDAWRLDLETLALAHLYSGAAPPDA